MATAGPEVTPNRRGARSRALVLDGAERVMAEHGYAGATIARVVAETGIPASSIYHYFGSKDGVLLAVMERGATRFFDALPDLRERLGTRDQHLEAAVAMLRGALEANPEFLRLLIVMATQPPDEGSENALAVVTRFRDEARRRIRRQYAVVFDESEDSAMAHTVAVFALSLIDGAFVAAQGYPTTRLDTVLRLLPAAVIALNAAGTRS